MSNQRRTAQSGKPAQSGRRINGERRPTATPEPAVAVAGPAETRLPETRLPESGLADRGLADMGLADSGPARGGRPESGPADADPAVPPTAAPAGPWALRWERWSQGQYLMTGIVLCALSLIGHAIPASGAAATARTVVCLIVGVVGAVTIVVPWVGRLRTGSRSGRNAKPGARTSRRPVDERLRQSPYPKALWVYSAWVTLLSVLAVAAFIALAVGRHSPGFILGVVVFGIPAILFGSLIWSTKDIWQRA
jgi:hypothetical protein